MVSRESTIQALGVAIAIAIFAAIALAFPEGTSDPGVGAVLVLVFYGIAFGGPNLYLYVRDEGNSIPRSSRARFLLTLGIVFPLLAAGYILDGARIGGVEYGTVLAALAGLAFIGYFANEMRHGYASSQTVTDSR